MAMRVSALPERDRERTRVQAKSDRERRKREPKKRKMATPKGDHFLFVENRGIEPLTSCLQSRRSTN